MSRRQWLVLVAAGIAVWLTTTILAAPAAVVPALFGEVAGYRLEQAHGSLWRGTARLQSPSGGVGDVHWELHGSSLLSGKLRLSLSLSGRDVALLGTVVHAPIGGTTRVLGLDGDISMALLARLSGIERLVEADIAVDTVDIHLQDGQLDSIEGVARLRDVTLLQPRTLLGQYTLQLGSADGWMRASVIESSGPMTATGELALTAAGEWRMDLRLQADDPSGDIARGLAFIGPADELGRRHLAYSGQL